MWKQWSWKAILGGLAVYIGGGLLIAIPYLLWMAYIGAAWEERPIEELPYFWVPTIVGLFIDSLSGYLCATWAPKRKMAHVVGLAILLLVSNLLFSDYSEPMSLYDVVTTIIVVPTALLGGWWRVKRHGPESAIQPKDSSSDSSPPISSPF